MLYEYLKNAMTLKLSHGFDYIVDDDNVIDNNIF